MGGLGHTPPCTHCFMSFRFLYWRIGEILMPLVWMNTRRLQWKLARNPRMSLYNSLACIPAGTAATRLRFSPIPESSLEDHPRLMIFDAKDEARALCRLLPSRPWNEIDQTPPLRQK